jgi:hypothetical protein
VAKSYNDVYEELAANERVHLVYGSKQSSLYKDLLAVNKILLHEKEEGTSK